MYKSPKKYLLIFLLLSFTIGQAHAGYEYVRAKTILNEKIIQEEETKENIALPPEMSYDFPDYDSEKSLGETLKKKFKQRFSKNKEEVQEEPQAQEKVSDKNKFKINADKITYSENDGNVYAHGNVEIISEGANVTLRADEATLDKETQTIKLQNNVKIIKDGVEVEGEYMLVDLNEENVLMDEPKLSAYAFEINAQEGYLVSNDIELLSGTAVSKRDSDIVLMTHGFMRNEPWSKEGVNDLLEKMEARHDSDNIYRIDAKKITLTSYKDHNSMYLKGAAIYYKNHKVLPRMDYEIISDKKVQIAEMGMLEAGNLRGFGAYVGWGFVNKLPEGQILKISPAITHGDGKIGVGIFGRYQTRNNYLEGGWNTSTNNPIARGEYKFNDTLTLQYGRQAYFEEGFMGNRRAGYIGQLRHERNFYVPNLKVNYKNSLYAGIMSDYAKKRQEHAYATTRFRYIGELNKEFFRFQNKEQDLAIKLYGAVQASATVYGSGETTGVLRVGPTLATKYKFWDSSIGYYLAGIHGESPFKFDEYRYGKSSIYLNEKFSLGDYVSIGYRATISPKKDNRKHDLLTESALYIMAGPKDLKISFSYDIVRDLAQCNFIFILGSDSSRINFDKLTTKDASVKNRDFYRRTPMPKLKESEDI